MNRALRILAVLLVGVFVLVRWGPGFDSRKVEHGLSEYRADPGTQGAAGKSDSESLETLVLGAGCFWCIEAVLHRIRGIEEVRSGYMGGFVANPGYEQVCSGATGHAEVVEVRYDPKVLPTEDLLTVFWELHDPTTLNRQGGDRGTQYRSAIFYRTDAQRKAAERSRREKDDSGDLRNPIVTEIAAATEFYPAEDYHQDFFEQNQDNRYCRAIIWPKLEKLGLVK